MRKLMSLAALAAMAIGITISGCGSNVAAPENSGIDALNKVTQGYIWSDGELFRTNGTPATFSGDHGNFDELYNTGGNGTFADGVAAISESKPGDQDYNGGRWHVNLLNDDVDPTKYEDATSVDDLDLDDFHSTDTYFECPLRPQRGNGHN
jgi:hypothetical protein